MFRGNWKALISPRHYRGIGQWYASQPAAKAWKFDPDQPRDDSGRWSAGGGTSPISNSAQSRGRDKLTGPQGLKPEVARERMQALVDRAKADGNYEKDIAWYQSAHDQIGERAAALNVDPQTYAAMVAATSPQCAWETSTGRCMNLDLATKAAETAQAFPGMGGKDVLSEVEKPGMLGNSLKNAVDIYNGKPPEEVLNGPKVSSFYNNMTWVNGTNDVTIDTHMARALMDDHNLGKASDDAAGKAALKEIASSGYGWAADQTRAVAEANGISPAQAQAVVWSQWKREE